MPAVKDEQLSCDMSLGTDMLRSIGGSLSMIMSRIEGQMRNEWSDGVRWALTFVCVLDALLDRVRGLAEDRPPDVRVDGHKRGEEADLALGRLRRRLCAPAHELEHTRADAVAERV